LIESLNRVLEEVNAVLDGLAEDDLAARPAPDANSIAWLLWHLTRVQDDHVAEVAGTEQVWTSGGFAAEFGLPFDTAETGYGHSAEKVAQVRVTGSVLQKYYEAVHQQTVAYLRGLSEADLDRIVDERWDPPVTLGVRLVSVINDDTQHVGQAAYVRGLLGR
jgi:uncharacterized damage-inducible protein DinB